MEDDKSGGKLKLLIGATLGQVSEDRGCGETDSTIAAAIGVARATYSKIKNNLTSPTLEALIAICRYFRVPIDTFIGPSGYLLEERDGLRWRVAIGLIDRRLRPARNAAEWMLAGASPGEIAVRLAKGQPDALKRTEPTVMPLARAGLGLELVELVTERDASDVQDVELADALARALAEQVRPSRPITVKVVRNFAHPEFERDPIAPFLIARVAHEVVSKFLEDHPLASTIGIAGGVHVWSFVHRIGRESSPFPESARRYDLVPLTLEPFLDHRFDLSDALVGEMYSRAALVLGAPSIRALSFKPFGFFEDHRIVDVDTQSWSMIRGMYPGLDVAIYGCGDRKDDGWIDWAQRLRGVRVEAETDVCLNMIDGRGEPIPLPEHLGQRRVYVGAGIDHIRSVASSSKKLALLLASGRSKGLPITLVARAGCVNAVVCDDAAARAALEVLRATRVSPGA